MTITLPPEVEEYIQSLVLRGEYPNAEIVIIEAIKALVREQERHRIESLLEETGIDSKCVEQLLQDAEDSGPYTDMTAEDWKSIEREGLVIVNARKRR